METLLRKYLWAVDGLIVVLCAVFLARASATVIGGKMLVSGGAPKPAARVATAPTAAPVYGKQVEEILRRNIFCSTCPPILQTEGGPKQPDAPHARPRRSGSRCYPPSGNAKAFRTEPPLHSSIHAC